jgi:ubiquinone/menaquinone biosynthesis C-methylase UbiE
MNDPQHGHGHPDGHQHDDSDTSFADLLDLDADVLRSYWTDALAWVRQAAADNPVQRILDLGAGTGTGAIALARLFGEAEVIAVDASEQMLDRIRRKAQDEGLAERVRTVRADLDEDWPALGPIDVTWASMSLHHLADPDRVLADILAATRPGGLLAVAEFTESLRFLPDDLGFGRPGLEARLLAALDIERAHSLPELGSDWAARLTAAGFTLLGERSFAIELEPPQPAATIDYARGWLQRVRSRTAQSLSPEDRDALAVLLDDDGLRSLPRRDDVRVSGCRTVTLARRPSGG